MQCGGSQPPLDDALLVIPFNVSASEYSVMVVLQDHNLDRIKRYDPAELPMRHIHAGGGGRQLRDVIVTYATDAEAREIERLARQGELKDALRMVSRGYRYRPDRGDGEGIWKMNP